MVYNTSFINTSTSLASLVTGVNTESNMMFSILILIAVWVIIFITTKQYDTKVAFISSSTTITILGVFMIAADWINNTTFIITLVLLMFSIIAYFFMD